MTKDPLKTNTRYFDTFESREEAFNQSVSHLIPCKYAGPRRFWIEFNQIIQHRLPNIHTHSTAYITSNPRDCLAFGTVSQVLTAARLISMPTTNNAVPSLEAIASEFHLSGSINQPIRTLSGGEMVKLALAKTFILAARCQKLSVASPFCWLSRQNIYLLETVVCAYQEQGLPVKIFALDGEDDLDDKPLLQSPHWLNHGPRFMIRSHNAKVVLGSAITEITAIPKVATISDVELQLLSPCLVKGNNGQGKSLVAKALSRAIKTEGQLFIGDLNGTSRLLFQDVINQTLLRSFNSLLQNQRCVKEGGAKRIFENIWNSYHLLMGTSPPKAFTAQRLQNPSLLSIKMLLVASRLCTLPNALILDEPDWGLNRRASEALVLSVIRSAHDLSIPVLIISHKPWWENLVRSCLLVRKVSLSSVSRRAPRFTVKLKKFDGR